MQVINNIRAHVLYHSSAAEKIGNNELACKIVSMKKAKNDVQILSLTIKINHLQNIINTINDKGERKTLDNDTKARREKYFQAKVPRNDVKLEKLNNKQKKYINQQNEYKSKTPQDTLSSNNIKLATTTIEYDYSVIGSTPINNYLRNSDGNALFEQFGNAGTQIVESMISTLEEGRLKGQPQSFFRIASDDNLVLTNSKVGDVFSDLGLLSAGVNERHMLQSEVYQEIIGDIATTPVVVTIKGNPAIVNKGSCLEAIFLPNSKLMVEKKFWIKDSDVDRDVLHISLVERVNYQGKTQDIYRV